MKTRFSLTSLSVAIMMFGVTVTMHETARTDGASQSFASVAAKLVELPELLWQLL